MPLVLQVFGRKLKYWTNSVLMMALDENSIIKSILRGTRICAPDFMALHPIVVQIYHSKPQMSPSRRRQRKNQRITKLSKIHYQEIMNVQNSHLVDVEIFHRISEEFDLLVVKKKSSYHQSQQVSSSGDDECLCKISQQSIQ